MRPAERPRFFYGWVIVGVVFLSNVVANSGGQFTFGLFVLPMAADLGVSRATIGWLPMARLVATAASSIPLGRIADRYGSRVLLPVAAVVMASAMYGVSRAPGFMMVLALFAVLGLADFSAPGNVITGVPITKWFVRMRGRATAVITVGFAVGGASFALLQQALIDSVGWRTAMAVSAFIVAAVIIPVPLLFMRRQPEDMGLLPDGVTVHYRDEQPEPAVQEEQWTLAEAIRTVTLWKIALAYLLSNFAVAGFLVHRAGFWEENGIPSGLIGAGFAVDSAGFALSALTGGLLVERVPARLLGATAAAIQGLAIALAIVWVSEPAVIIAPFLFGIGGGTLVVMQTVIWADYYGRRFQGSIRGLVVPIMLVGFGLGPPSIGLLYDAAGGSYLGGFWFAAALMVPVTALLLSAKPPRRVRAGVAERAG